MQIQSSKVLSASVKLSLFFKARDGEELTVKPIQFERWEPSLDGVVTVLPSQNPWPREALWCSYSYRVTEKIQMPGGSYTDPIPRKHAPVCPSTTYIRQVLAKKSGT